MEFRAKRGTFLGDESMASRNLFTEEGRTRLRNFGLRLRSYLIVFLILGLLAGAFWFSNRTRVEMGALERLYFRQ